MERGNRVTCVRMDITLAPGMPLNSYIRFFLRIFCIITCFGKDMLLNKIFFYYFEFSVIYMKTVRHIYIFRK